MLKIAKLNSWIGILAVGILTIPLIIAMPIMYKTEGITSLNQCFTLGNTCFLAVGASFLIITCISIMWWKVYSTCNTYFSDKGIEYPTLKGLRTLNWEEINKVETFQHSTTFWVFEFSDSNKSIRVSVGLYDQKKLGDLLLKYLPDNLKAEKKHEANKTKIAEWVTLQTKKRSNM